MVPHVGETDTDTLTETPGGSAEAPEEEEEEEDEFGYSWSELTFCLTASLLFGLSAARGRQSRGCFPASPERSGVPVKLTASCRRQIVESRVGFS